VKTLSFAGMVMALSAISAAAPAQKFTQFTSFGYQFIDAVRDRDGNKLNALLESQPAGLVNSKSIDGDTGLNITIARSDYDWTAFLINKGADPNLAGKGGDTPLIVASRVGFADAVRWLLKRGAKVDLDNRMGETPLIVAVQQRQVPIVRLLLAEGANPDEADSAAGLSARDYARRDTRSRQILQLIEAKKPKAAAASR
jgi:ankyrin repeat protein